MGPARHAGMNVHNYDLAALVSNRAQTSETTCTHSIYYWQCCQCRHGVCQQVVIMTTRA